MLLLGPLSSTSKKSILLDQRSSTVFIITLLILKFITQLSIKNYLLTALRTSSRWPSTPPNIAIQTSVLTFHNLKAWSFDTDNSKLGSRGWNLSSFIAWPWPVEHKVHITDKKWTKAVISKHYHTTSWYRCHKRLYAWSFTKSMDCHMALKKKSVCTYYCTCIPWLS